MKRNLPLALAAIACLIVTPVKAQQNPPNSRIALLIANANYPDATAPLATPIKDARAVGDELKRLGFDVDLRSNLNKADTQKAVDAFISKINKGSTALFFFSGFGLQASKRSYAIPTDAQIWTEADVGRDGTNIESIVTKMNQKGAGVKVLIIDASRRNPYERRFRAISSGLAALDLPDGTLAIYSAGTDKVAADSDGANSVFIAQLLQELRPAGVNGDSVFGRTRLDVSRATNGEQVPWVSSSLIEDFFFSPPASSAAAPTHADPVKADVGKPEPLKAEVARPGPVKPDTAKVEAAKIETAKVEVAKQDATKPDATKPDATKPPRDKTIVTTPMVEDPAIKELNAKIQQNPNDAAAFYNRGQIFAKNGDYSRAVTDFDQAIRLDPNDAAALNNRCWARGASGDLDLALRDCNEALRLRPDFADALDSRGLIYLKLNMNSIAVADYDAALKLKPNQASSLYGRGIGEKRLGRTPEGNSDIAAAKVISPGIADEFATFGVR
jgi:uncharacterized caspase-like protein